MNNIILESRVIMHTNMLKKDDHVSDEHIYADKKYLHDIVSSIDPKYHTKIHFIGAHATFMSSYVGMLYDELIELYGDYMTVQKQVTIIFQDKKSYDSIIFDGLFNHIEYKN